MVARRSPHPAPLIASGAASVCVLPAGPPCSELSRFSCPMPLAPGAKVPHDSPRSALRVAKLSIVPSNVGEKCVAPFVFCDTRLPHSSGSFLTRGLWLAVSISPPRAAPWIVLSRSPASPTGPHVCLPECGGSLLARISPPASMAICLAAHRDGHGPGCFLRHNWLQLLWVIVVLELVRAAPLLPLLAGAVLRGTTFNWASAASQFCRSRPGIRPFSSKIV